jgi:hypothetical protein
MGAEAMREGQFAASEERPLIQRIVRFPLAAMALALAAFIVVSGTVAGLLEITLRHLPANDLDVITGLVVSLAMVAVYKLLIRHLGESPRDDLSGPGAVRQLVAGLGIGFGLLSVIVAVAALIGIYWISGTGDLSFLTFALVTDGLAPAIGEELLFRAILFRWIEEFAGSWAALVISSLLFGLSHLDNPNATAFATIGIALEGGLLLGAAYMLTRRLWLSMGIHAAWNLTQGEIYDIPVSGNPVHGLLDAHLDGSALLTGNGFGLEASPIAIVIGTLFAVFLIIRAVRAGQLVQPLWMRSKRI